MKMKNTMPARGKNVFRENDGSPSTLFKSGGEIKPTDRDKSTVDVPV